MHIVLLQPMVYTLAGMTAATVYIADMLLELGHSVTIITKKTHHLRHYDAHSLGDYYSLRHEIPIEEMDYASVYGAREEYYSKEFIERLKSADAIISFDESLSLLPLVVHLDNPFYQFYHFPSKNAPPDKRVSVICNSKYTAKYVREFYGINASVIYPVPHSGPYYSTTEKDIDILWVGRIATDKNIELLNRVATKNRRVVAIGSHWWPEFTPKELNENITVIHDAPITVLRDCYSKAKIFLSTKGLGESDPNHCEHFGIGVVEAAYSGAIPLVHKSGGPYIDFLEEQQGKYGYYYSDEGTLNDMIDDLLVHKRKVDDIRARACWLYESSFFRLNFLLNHNV